MSDSDRAIEIYDRNAAMLAEQYETVGTGTGLLHLVPDATPGALALDIGAGSGRDAVFLVAKGYDVIAVEPSSGLRAEGQRRHPTGRISWIDDRLPALEAVHGTKTMFDFILVAAVWHHVALEDRSDAFSRIAGLMKPGAGLLMTLRLGPAPEGQPIFPVSVAEIEDLAGSNGLVVSRTIEADDELGRKDLAWATLCLAKPA